MFLSDGNVFQADYIYNNTEYSELLQYIDIKVSINQETDAKQFSNNKQLNLYGQ